MVVSVVFIHKYAYRFLAVLILKKTEIRGIIVMTIYF